MDKKYILTFSISGIVLMTIAIIMLMLLVPQQKTILESSVKEYSKVTKSNYTYSQTKDISEEALIQVYTITSEDLKTFEAKNLYVAGNADPFTPTEDMNQAIEEDNSQEETTNSNGGVANPESTNK